MGRVIMSGVVPLLSKPIKGTALSKLDEGAIIKINEGGNPVEFYVAKHDYEAGLNGAGRTLVVRKDCYSNSTWDSSQVNAYADSTIDNVLNTTYKNLFSAKLQKTISTTKFYYTVGNRDATVSALERAIFQLSLTELDKTADYANVEGSVLPTASILQIAYWGGATRTWWTRTPNKGNSISAYALYVSGGRAQVTDQNTNSDHYYRPCFTLPPTIKIDDTGLLIG